MMMCGNPPMGRVSNLLKKDKEGVLVQLLYRLIHGRPGQAFALSIEFKFLERESERQSSVVCPESLSCGIGGSESFARIIFSRAYGLRTLSSAFRID